MYNPNSNPVLANGHLGFTVFDTSIYMNGLYNGKMGESHRARIENHANMQAECCDRTPNVNCTYRFHIKRGFFKVFYSGDDYHLAHTVFPHRYYTRTIVNKFTLERHNMAGNITVKVATRPGNIGMDMSFPDMKTVEKAGYRFRCETGHTMAVENEAFQSDTQKLTFCFNELLNLTLPEKRSSIEFYSFMIVDQDESVVMAEMDKVVRDSQMEHRHVEAWEDFWASFDIEIDSRMDLNGLTRASIYALVSNVPPTHSFEPPRPFYGISSTGEFLNFALNLG